MPDVCEWETRLVASFVHQPCVTSDHCVCACVYICVCETKRHKGKKLGKQRTNNWKKTRREQGGMRKTERLDKEEQDTELVAEVCLGLVSGRGSKGVRALGLYLYGRVSKCDVLRHTSNVRESPADTHPNLISRAPKWLLPHSHFISSEVISKLPPEMKFTIRYIIIFMQTGKNWPTLWGGTSGEGLWSLVAGVIRVSLVRVKAALIPFLPSLELIKGAQEKFRGIETLEIRGKTPLFLTFPFPPLKTRRSFSLSY